MAHAIIDQILTYIEGFKIQHLDISIETPIMNHNVSSFEKQWRLVQELESGILHRLAGELLECWVTEVAPSQSKVLATNDGRAKKEDMIAASPFKDRVDLAKSTREALADAWAHGLATWATKGGRFNFGQMQAATVRQVL